MTRLVVSFLALLASGLADPLPQKPADKVLLEKQVDFSLLFYHVHEPTYEPKLMDIAKTWDIEKNIDDYTNVTAVKTFADLHDCGLLLRAMPFNIHEETHKFEVQTLFHVLMSAKDYETFYKTAVWMREHVNEYVFVYVVSVAILHRPDTQGIIIPPIYEIFPSYFFNGIVLNEAQRVNIHGLSHVDHYPLTYVWEGNVVLKENYTIWPFQNDEEMKVNYFTWDHGLNAFYYNWHLTYPEWLGSEVTPLVKDRRGEWFWFGHQQLVARYYMERLSNGLGEIPELDWDVPVKTGIWTGLLYHSGIPYPVRSDNFVLNQPHLVEEIDRIQDFERRVRDAIDQGYVLNSIGEQIDIKKPEAIDILGRIIQANPDSPNVAFYGDFISLWKKVLGGSVHHIKYSILYHGNTPLVLPSLLEHYQTALRDPAFFMIWKRILNIFAIWQSKHPHYRREELALPSVVIKSVEVDKLVTYFEQSYVNITNHLYMNEHEAKAVHDDVSVLVQRPRLNHKSFEVRIRVNSESAKTVIVRLFLAPKYDSQGEPIPLIKNWRNFFQLDQFTYDLPQGETLIKRDAVHIPFTNNDLVSGYEVFEKAMSGVEGKTQYLHDPSQRFDGFPHRILLPKGRVGGMPFVLMAFISEYRAPKVPQGQGFDKTLSLGLGSGARFMTDEPLGFPVNRPIYDWQVKGLTNLWLQDVLIYHKHTPEIYVHHLE